LSLRGHGRSEGGEMLARTRFLDYLEDVTRTIQHLGDTPILIGHSLGGMLIQKFLEKQPAPAAVCISTPNPKSLRTASLKLTRHYPSQMLKMMLTMNPDHVYKDPKIVKTLFFSQNLPDAQLNGFLDQLLQQNESRRLFLDVLFLRFSKPMHRTPMLVLGGARDYGVSQQAFGETAALYGTKPVILDEMPHDLMIEKNWEIAANRILEWLDQQGV
jgi:alpha-beta hydrolase superfamily lysophospholipase